MVPYRVTKVLVIFFGKLLPTSIKYIDNTYRSIGKFKVNHDEN